VHDDADAFCRMLREKFESGHSTRFEFCERLFICDAMVWVPVSLGHLIMERHHFGIVLVSPKYCARFAPLYEQVARFNREPRAIRNGLCGVERAGITTRHECGGLYPLYPLGNKLGLLLPKLCEHGRSAVEEPGRVTIGLPMANEIDMFLHSHTIPISATLGIMDIKIDRTDEMRLRAELEARTDFDAARMKRYLAMPDLSRTPGSPLYEIVQRVKAAPSFQGFDDIEIPEIVPTSILFDLFDFPADHPARSASDTYLVDDKNALRTHDTVFWYYYLNQPEIKERIARGESMGALCYGKVYRKDEIDSRHMNTFHQMGAWYIAPDSVPVTEEDLKKVFADIVHSVFGPTTEFRVNLDNFPYTDPSFEVEVNVKGTAAEGPAKGEWLEILGSGMPKKTTLSKLGLEGYHGWAFGFGIERLAIISMALPDIRLLWSEDERIKKQLVLGTTYKEVSKYPPVVRDISFIVKNGFVPNNYFDLVRDVLGDMAEDVSLLDKYENAAKLGEGNVSYAYRITYRSLERTLTNDEVNALHKQLEESTVSQFGATIR